MSKVYKNLVILFFIPCALWGATIPYSVEIEGVDDGAILKEIRSSSQLFGLKKRPPNSINALRFRAESDAPDLLKILHAHGYLEAKIDIQLREGFNEQVVILQIDLGPIYRIAEYVITLKDGETPQCKPPKLHDLGITLGAPLETKKILDSEVRAVEILAECGYPLARIENREIIADGNIKEVQIFITIDIGPLARFGKTTIFGNTSVKDELIEKQIQWCENARFDSCLVEGTRCALLDTGLFTSVYITHPEEEFDPYEPLPMQIELAESKHKSISIGVSYQTTYGAGATFGWENRNVSGLGRTLCLQANVAQRSISGVASYLVPNFHCLGDSYRIVGQIAQESIKPYRMQSYSLLNSYERCVGGYFYYSVGALAEYLVVSNSVDNGNFFLLEAPIHLRWTNVEDFLNPLRGYRFDYHAVPAVNIKEFSEFYYAQTFTFSSYFPIFKKELLILAQKLNLGTIFSNGLDAVPVPKRFFGGSEENLRGYRYYTVSPLTKHDKPIGGRSAVFYTIEPRFRFTECFGLVPFFDIGNVYSNQLPTFKGKWRKSVGIGFRYFSFIGPLRLDVAFPLDRREGLDPHWWVFVSLGQSF